MSDDPSPSSAAERPWLDRLFKLFAVTPRNKEELAEILAEARENRLLDDEAMDIMQGALSVDDKQAGEIMIPRPQMVVIRASETLQEFLPRIIESRHSRYPVIGEKPDDVRGILLAKDLLTLLVDGVDSFEIANHLHSANIIPESKRLNDLLREFREERYHMAIVVDEYGSVAGLVTIEDVLEEIVGEIEDETDTDEEVRFIRKISERDYALRALTPISQFNQQFGAHLDDSEYDTIGGILIRHFGRLPRRNELATIDGFRFRILNADNRQVHMIRLTLPDAEPVRDE